MNDRLAAGTPLSREELDFIGSYQQSHSERGWHQPEDSPYELDSILSAEDTAILQALMNAGSVDRVEFLG